LSGRRIPSSAAGYPRPFFVAMGASLLLFFSLQALFPVLPLFIAQIGGKPADNGLATWVFALAAMIVRPLAGTLADRWGCKPVMVMGAVLFGLTPLVYAVIPGIPALLLVRLVHGAGMALFSTAYPAYMAEMLSPGRYGEGMGIANVASSVAMVVAPLFGEWALARYSFFWAFVLASLVGVGGVAATAVLPRQGPAGPRPAEPQPQGGGLRQVWARPGIRTGAWAMVLLGVPFGAFIVFLPLLAEARGLGGTGAVFGAYAAATSLAQPIGGRAADRWGAMRVAWIGVAGSGLVALGLAGAAGRTSLLIWAALFGIGFGVAQSGISAHVQASVLPSQRAGGAAIQYTAFDLVVGFSSWALGLLAGATDYGVMYAVSGATLLVGLLATLGYTVARTVLKPESLPSRVDSD